MSDDRHEPGTPHGSPDEDAETNALSDGDLDYVPGGTGGFTMRGEGTDRDGAAGSHVVPSQTKVIVLG